MYNRLPSKNIDFQTSYALMYNRDVDYIFLRIFWSQYFPYLRSFNKQKLEAKSISCVFLGYAPQKKGNCILISLQVKSILAGMLHSMKNVSFFLIFRYPYLFSFILFLIPLMCYFL